LLGGKKNIKRVHKHMLFGLPIISLLFTYIWFDFNYLCKKAIRVNNELKSVQESQEYAYIFLTIGISLSLIWSILLIIKLKEK
jgi:hypothetical protein